MRVLRVEEDVCVADEWPESLDLEYMLDNEQTTKDNTRIEGTQVNDMKATLTIVRIDQQLHGLPLLILQDLCTPRTTTTIQRRVKHDHDAHNSRQ